MMPFLPQDTRSIVRFVDRQAAGEQLAQAVWQEAQPLMLAAANFVVYALPKGGLPVALPIAQRLNCPLDVIVAKKITRPANPELAIGAVTADGHVVWDDQRHTTDSRVTLNAADHNTPDSHASDSHASDSHASDSHASDSHTSDSHASDSHTPDSHLIDGHAPATLPSTPQSFLSPDDIALQEAHTHAQLQLEELSPDSPRFSPQGAIAILVDDGIATGMTMAAAVQAVRSQQPAQIWICAPVAPVDLMPFLRSYGDRVIVLATPHPFYSVSRFYQTFPQVSMAEAAAYLQ